jgi:hypothetical protein
MSATPALDAVAFGPGRLADDFFPMATRLLMDGRTVHAD